MKASSRVTGSSKPRKVKAKDFICQFDDCGKAFARRSDLVRHHRIHTNERWVFSSIRSLASLLPPPAIHLSRFCFGFQMDYDGLNQWSSIQRRASAFERDSDSGCTISPTSVSSYHTSLASANRRSRCPRSWLGADIVQHDRIFAADPSNATSAAKVSFRRAHSRFTSGRSESCYDFLML